MSSTGDFIQNKSKDFAIRIVNLYKYLVTEKKEYILSKQLLRSGTSIGANLSEAQCAISKNDFLAKVYISLKEASETIYWIDLLHNTDYLTDEQYKSIILDSEEIKKLLVSITKHTIENQIKNQKSKLNNE
jgi:four helix bundle protein